MNIGINSSSNSKCILWDFDNTPAYRRGGMWRAALTEALDLKRAGHNISADALRKPLRDRFPWHEWHKPHPELSSPELWWQHVESIIADAYRSVGVAESECGGLATLAHQCYINPDSFELYPDTIPVLKKLAGRGWRHLILSNHVPELEMIVDHLGLTAHVDHVLSSALTGYEKPHPEAFKLARKFAGDPKTIWMVGDNPVSDVEGAERCGISAILVRTQGSDARLKAANLRQVVIIIESPSP